MTTAARATATKPLLREFGEAKRDSLIPILQKAQEVHGYLSEEAIAEIGRHLKLPASKVYGVATFYNQFRFTPKGKFHIMLCRGTACHVKGSLKLLDAVTRTLKLQAGQTTRDGMFSLEVVACMGACGLAPAMSVNGEMYAKVTPKKVGKIIDECRAKEQANVRA
jgi:NADH-quinone oxidoreductase E subunit